MTDDKYQGFYERGREIRKSQSTEEFLRAQLNLRNHFAHFGWFEFTEPEEGEGTCIAHTSDLETYIVGHIMNGYVVLDPGDDFVRLNFNDFSSVFAFMEEFKREFNRLVKDWYQ